MLILATFFITAICQSFAFVVLELLKKNQPNKAGTPKLIHHNIIEANNTALCGEVEKFCAKNTATFPLTPISTKPNVGSNVCAK